MAQITGVEAAGWHQLVQNWWQFVMYPLWFTRAVLLMPLLGSRCVYSRFGWTGIWVSTLCSLSRPTQEMESMLEHLADFSTFYSCLVHLGFCFYWSLQ